MKIEKLNQTEPTLEKIALPPIDHPRYKPKINPNLPVISSVIPKQQPWSTSRSRGQSELQATANPNRNGTRGVDLKL
jgi:hypothetical protein